MKETERIRDQMRRAFQGEAWHGPSLRELLDGVSARQAAQRPLGAAHTIWELVLHIAVWEDVVRRRLGGEQISELAADRDWPQLHDRGEASWRETLEALERGHQRLLAAVEGLTDQRLTETVRGESYSAYAMLHGLIQHDLYHAGQIALLKKALA